MGEVENSKAQASILQGNAAFANRLYQLLARKPGNLFFSPLSVHAVIAMAHQGAKEETARAIEEVLQIPEAIRIAAVGYQTVAKSLKSLEDVVVYLAFKIYFKKDLELDDDFVGNVREFFASEVECVDFKQKDQVVKNVNEWVEKQPAEKIKNIVSPSVIDNATAMLLINAIYFKGDWSKKFLPRSTSTQKFYVDEKNTIDVEMMRKVEYGFYKFDETLNAQIAFLTFKNTNARMIIVLPKERSGICSLETKLSTHGFTILTADLARECLDFALPKFKMETTIDLSEALTEMGLANIFSKKADFSGMLKSASADLCVAKVLQKTFIDVNESGVEAAAVTVMPLMKKKGRVEEPVPFVVDHPAVFLIVVDVESATNVLFCGRLSQPCN